MGWLNRALGFPDIDPTGRDRSYFRKSISLAVNEFFTNGNPDRGRTFIVAGTDKVLRNFGEHHPDVYRFALFTAVFISADRNFHAAMVPARMAKDGLSELGKHDFDYLAASDLVNQLTTIILTEEPGDDSKVNFKDSPIGAFFEDCCRR
jgi:hypothetical protein